MPWLNDLFSFGPTCTEQDVPRISQMERVKAYLSTHQWYTLAEIEAYTGYPQASISAQLRHLRKPKFGGYLVEKRRRVTGGGTWEYKLSLDKTEPEV
jgi:hypothetical protein